MVLVELILLLVVAAGLWLLLYLRTKSFASRLPAVQPYHPVIGNALLFVGKTDEQRFLNIVRAFAHPARLFKFMVAGYPMLVTNEPEVAQKILTSTECLEKPFLYDFFKLDYGLFAAHLLLGH
ncbi:hypothetical protein pipiens_008519 [Culex pipiens pipiens]|uniref:Cytochrome P450 n=1 Tax=Culex pipiens pipiens TaxID=38569 RepID=A0ABD1DHM3_CULPP